MTMTEHESSRTLVKSTPELWAECSDPAALARHLGSVGEIRITRLEPETTVAWEGAAARGTVALEPAGWGTRVTLTMCQTAATDAGPETAAGAEAEPAAASSTTSSQLASDPPEHAPAASGGPVTPAPATLEPAGRPGWFHRLLTRLRGGLGDAETPIADGPDATAAPPEPRPGVTTAEAPAEAPSPGAPAETVLRAALDSLGRAHHRPYSRA